MATRKLLATGVLVLTIGSSVNAADSDIDRLRATQASFRAVADHMRPFLVRIETVGGSQPPELVLADPDSAGSEDGRPRRRTQFRDAPGSDFVVADGPTTGIVYSSDGYIVASSFNFVRQPLLISATFADGRRLAAELVARDQVRKIALLKVETTGLTVPTWRQDDDVCVGEWAVALGLGFGGSHPSVTAGIISALNRMHGNAVQTDAKLSPANYGGPLCDIQGRVIGICVPMAQRPGELAGIELYDSGVGFAVPKSRVDEIVAALREGGSIYRGWLGISIDPRSADAVRILKLADPSPMRSAGARSGDRILWAEGRELRHFGDLVQTLYMIPAGEPVYLHLARTVEQMEYVDIAGVPALIPRHASQVELCVQLTLARNTELGELLDQATEPFDPSMPLPSSNDENTP